MKEASEQPGINARMINYYCAKDRVPGAVRAAGVWLVLKDARKPTDGRRGRLDKNVGGNDESE